MKKILLVGLLGITFFQNLQSALWGSDQALKFLAHILGSEDNSVAKSFRLASAVYNMNQMFTNPSSLNFPINFKDAATSEDVATVSQEMITPKILAQMPKAAPFVVSKAMIDIMRAQLGNPVNSSAINRYYVNIFVATNERLFKQFYRSGMITIPGASLNTEMMKSNDDTLTLAENNAVVNTLLSLYQHYSAVEKAINKVQSIPNSVQPAQVIKSEIAKLETKIDPKLAEIILDGAFAFAEVTRQATIVDVDDAPASVSKVAPVVLKMNNGMKILAAGSEFFALDAAMKKNLDQFEQTIAMRAIGKIFGVQDAKDLSTAVKEITEHREQTEEIKAKAIKVLKKDPTADIAPLMAQISSHVLPAALPTSLVNQNESLTNAFLEGVRDVCLPKVVELAGSGSNAEIVKTFEQTVLNREAGYTSEERAYMLGYFQNSLWQIQDDKNNPFDQRLLKIVEVSRALHDHTKNNVRG